MLMKHLSHRQATRHVHRTVKKTLNRRTQTGIQHENRSFQIKHKTRDGHCSGCRLVRCIGWNRGCQGFGNSVGRWLVAGFDSDQVFSQERELADGLGKVPGKEYKDPINIH
jgi:hypothetical protein